MDLGSLVFSHLQVVYCCEVVCCCEVVYTSSKKERIIHVSDGIVY